MVVTQTWSLINRSEWDPNNNILVRTVPVKNVWCQQDLNNYRATFLVVDSAGCCTHWCKKQMFGDFQDVFRDVTLMANSFNLCRGGLSMCPGDTVLWRAADESRAERSQASSFIHARSKQASYKSGSCGYLCIALSSGGVLLWVQEELSVCLLLISLFRMICFSSLSILVTFKRFSA